MRQALALAVVLCFAGLAPSRGQSPNSQSSGQPADNRAPYSQSSNNGDATQQQPEQDHKFSAVQDGGSSSKNTQVDLSPPPDDAKNHPDSAAAVSEAEEESGANSLQVEEFHPFNPHKAMKDIEVGDFYFRQNNYKAALSRYQEALLYKPNDAVANFHLAQCFEKLNSPQDAVEHYQAYLKVMPHGPLARDAEKALAKLHGQSNSGPRKSQ